jgi:hypothetical protein
MDVLTLWTFWLYGPFDRIPYLSSHLKLMSGNANNGRLYCVVSQLIIPQQSDSRIPSLNSQKFFLLMPVGTATDQGTSFANWPMLLPSYQRWAPQNGWGCKRNQARS